MTAHKHFKKLVRARMEKTGESYSTARRQLLRDVDPPADLRAHSHLPGSVPGATALRILLTAAGVRDPHRKAPLSEAMAFGLAGGIGIGVAAFVYEKEDFASFYVAGRHRWWDDRAYLTEGLEVFALEPRVLETSGAKGAQKQLREALAGGLPAIAWVDMTGLPHRAMPPCAAGNIYHLVTVYAVDEAAGTARIGDLTDDPVEIPLADLTAARGKVKRDKHRLVTTSATRPPDSLAPLLRPALARCAAGLVGKPKKGYPDMFNLDGLAKWAERMDSAKGKDAWATAFAPGGRMWRGLLSIHEYIEHYGTGGGLGRPLFAEFLDEAAGILRDRALADLAKAYAALGARWSALADAALPAEAPMFRQARELITRRTELLAQADPSATEELRSVGAQLEALEKDAKWDFPLAAPRCAELRQALAAQIRALHEAEVAARQALAAAAG